MFLKLLKWDLRSQRKLLILFLIYLLSIVNVAIAKAIGMEWLITIAIVFFMLLSGALMIAPLILLAINYYNDFYGKNAYTMHQISVKTSTIFNSKLLSGSLYMLAAFGLFFFGIFMLVAIFGGFSATASLLEKMGELSTIIATIPDYIENLSAFSFWSLSILAIIFSMLSAQVSYAFIVTFGNIKMLRNLGKGGIFVSLIIYYLVSQVISYLTILYVPFIIVVEKSKGMLVRLSLSSSIPFSTVVNNGGLSNFEAQGVVGFFPIGSMFASMLLVALCYFYVVYALNKKLNVS